MFNINNIQWHIKFVHPNSEYLYREDGTLTIGMCDNNTKTIYINETLQGKKLKKVLCHELTHAAMFSYQVYLSYEQEEVVADIIATYGEEIISITDILFEKIKMERL
jgi:hypothetical protein